MPETTYMAVDPRRDHSLRVPRPDLSVKYDVPNACTGCHLERSKLEPVKTVKFEQYADWIRAAAEGDKEIAADLDAIDQWAADKTKEWYGEKTPATPHFADTFYKARLNRIEAQAELLKIVADRKMPDIVRGTAIVELSRFTSVGTRPVLSVTPRICRRTSMLKRRLITRRSKKLTSVVKSVMAQAVRMWS